MKNNKTNEPRYIGTNWDKVKVTETDRAHSTSARKVITRGEYCIKADELIAETIAKLRQGYEVRFLDGEGEPAIRLYPCLAKGTNHMEATARPMGKLKTSLNDKTVALRQRDGSRTPVEDADDAPEGVTPDIVVTCPTCGRHIRVHEKRTVADDEA